MLLNNERMPMIALYKTRLDLTNVGIDNVFDAYYTDHLPEYLTTKFPLYGTNRVGNITSSTLYLPYSTTAYLIRFVFMFEGFLSCIKVHYTHFFIKIYKTLFLDLLRGQIILNYGTG